MGEVEPFGGAKKSILGVMVCPDLMGHISKALESEAQIQKQSRKAREEKALART